MSDIEENIELEKNKRFFLYKRSTLFNSIFNIFLFMTCLITTLEFRYTMYRHSKLVLVLSIVALMSFTFKFLLRSFQYRLNRIGVALVQCLIVIQIIYFILKIEVLLGL